MRFIFGINKRKALKEQLPGNLCHLIIAQCQLDNKKLLSFLIRNRKEMTYISPSRGITSAE